MSCHCSGCHFQISAFQFFSFSQRHRRRNGKASCHTIVAVLVLEVAVLFRQNKCFMSHFTVMKQVVRCNSPMMGGSGVAGSACGAGRTPRRGVPTFRHLCITLGSRSRRFFIFVSLAGCLVGAVAAAQPPPPSAASAADAKPDFVGKSVVKIFSTARYPDRFQPWIKKAPVSSSATGVVIEGRRILTTAHSVAYASEVQVQANGAKEKVTARSRGFLPRLIWWC